MLTKIDEFFSFHHADLFTCYETNRGFSPRVLSFTQIFLSALRRSQLSERLKVAFIGNAFVFLQSGRDPFVLS
jgi:hypothetical protein